MLWKLLLSLSALLLPSSVFGHYQRCNIGRTLDQGIVTFWCGPKPPSTLLLNKDRYISYGRIKELGNNTLEIHEADPTLKVDEIASGGLSMFQSARNLSLRFPVRRISSEAFEGLSNLRSLRIQAKNIAQCAFVSIGFGLDQLTVEGYFGSLSLHKDAFNGLPNLITLQMHKIVELTSKQATAGEKLACEHFFCALKQLKYLRVGVSYQRQRNCQLRIRGFPSGARVEPYRQTNPAANVSCMVRTRPCRSRVGLCGTLQVCQLPFTFTPTSVHWTSSPVPFFLILIIPIFAGSVLGVIIWGCSRNKTIYI